MENKFLWKFHQLLTPKRIGFIELRQVIEPSYYEVSDKINNEETTNTYLSDNGFQTS